MSMNFSEFKKLIGADPWSRDPETQRARKSSAEFEQAAVEAEAFEQKLHSALHIQAPDDLLDSIRAITEQPAKRRNWMPLAMAASLVIAVGAVTMVWNQSRQWESVEAYLAYHYSHDGDKTLGKIADGVSEQDINNIMASLNASAGQQLTGMVKFIKFCPTPQGRGAHMVVSTDQGPMTIIFMPDTDVIDGEVVEFDQMHAYLVNLERGSAAIIGRSSQPVEMLEVMVRNSIKINQLGV
jgi:hypothetical protein